ncbi:MAG: helix-turn-helix domain-containing protein [Bryobacteraceae bacterium]
MKTKATPNKKKLLSPHDVAREYGFGVTAVYKMLGSGQMPHIRVGKRYLVPRSAIERWLETCGSSAAA